MPFLLPSSFQALDAFRAAHGRLPAPASPEDADAVVSEARRLAEPSGAGADLDEGVLKLLAFGAAGELNPMAAMFGGIVGQEVGFTGLRSGLRGARQAV